MSTTASSPTKLDSLAVKYRRDHQNPVNHILHVYIGWPLCALGVMALPFRPWWFLALFGGGYLAMWTGHLVFERNVPTVFKHPTTPFVIAWDVIKTLASGLARLATFGRLRSPEGTPPLPPRRHDPES